MLPATNGWHRRRRYSLNAFKIMMGGDHGSLWRWTEMWSERETGSLEPGWPGRGGEPRLHQPGSVTLGFRILTCNTWVSPAALTRHPEGWEGFKRPPAQGVAHSLGWKTCQLATMCLTSSFWKCYVYMEIFLCFPYESPGERRRAPPGFLLTKVCLYFCVCLLGLGHTCVTLENQAALALRPTQPKPSTKAVSSRAKGRRPKGRTPALSS